MIIEAMTAENFAPFGVLLEPPAAPARTGRLFQPASLRPNALPSMTLMHFAPEPRERAITQMERHMHSGQAFLHLGGGGLLVAVAPDADGRPDLARLHVFATLPGQGFAYHPGIWHAGVAALDAPVRLASLVCWADEPADVEEVDLAAPVRFTLP